MPIGMNILPGESAGIPDRLRKRRPLSDIGVQQPDPNAENPFGADVGELTRRTMGMPGGVIVDEWGKGGGQQARPRLTDVVGSREPSEAIASTSRPAISTAITPPNDEEAMLAAGSSNLKRMGEPASQMDVYQRQLTDMDKKPSFKRRLLSMGLAAAPSIIAAIAGDRNDVADAAGGTVEGLRFNQQRQDLKRKTLLQQIEHERDNEYKRDTLSESKRNRDASLAEKVREFGLRQQEVDESRAARGQQGKDALTARAEEAERQRQFQADQANQNRGLQRELAASRKSGRGYELLTADEVKQAGLPEGTVAQRGTDGKVSVVTKAPSAMDRKRQLELEDREHGKAQTALDLDRAMKTVDEIGAHPGLSEAIGMPGWKTVSTLGAYKKVPGTDLRDFRAKVDTLKSQMFLQSIQKMRGFGALSNMEGSRVESAIASLNEDMSEKQYRDTLKAIKQGFANLKQLAVQEGGGAGAAGTSADDPLGIR